MSLLHARQVGGTGLAAIVHGCAMLASSAGGDADRGTGRREAWALGLLVPREQDIAAEQEHVETGGAGDAGRRAGVRGRVRCKRSP